MSGICGIINFDGEPVDQKTIQLMSDAVAYRGPDGICYWRNGGAALAHLAFNLTPESRHETQPHVVGELVLVADVRIDNREELIDELSAKGHLVHREATDADLILAAYRCWGKDSATHLIGDFAFAIWNKARKQLFAARDSMGMRTLYYLVEPGRLVFATEVKQLLALPDVQSRIFEPAVGAHLAGPYGRPEWTFYAGINQLAPAHALVADPESCRTWRYWDIDPEFRVEYRNEEAYAEHFFDIFEKAVRCRLRCTKPLGIFLSGGMDSGSIAATAGWLLEKSGKAVNASVHTYSWAFTDLTDCDERHISNAIVNRYDLASTHVAADAAWPLAGYPDHGPDRDDPFIWVYQALIDQTLAKSRCEGMALMLSGDRGDEMMGDWVYDYLGLLRAGKWRTLYQELQECSRVSKVSLRKAVRRHLMLPLLSSGEADWLHRAFRSLTPGVKLGKERKTAPVFPDWVRPEFATRIGLSETIRQSAVKPHLKDYARQQRYGRIFMFMGARIAALNERRQASFGLGFADPWSDRRIATFVLAVPQWVIQRRREHKRLARQAMLGIMPESVRNRATKIEPVALFERAFRQRARKTVMDLIRNSKAVAYGYVDKTALEHSYNCYLRGTPQPFDFWWPLTLEMWLRSYWP